MFLLAVIFCLCFYFFKFFFFFFWAMPDWWYTKPITDMIVRRILLILRWLYRRIVAKLIIPKILWLCGHINIYRLRDSIDRGVYKARKSKALYAAFCVRLFRIARWFVYSLFYRRFPHFFVRVSPDTVIVYVCIRPFREYAVLFFCLCLYFFKSLFKRISTFHLNFFNNAFVLFLLNLGKPLSFLNFTLMLGFLVYVIFAVLRILSFCYNSITVLLVFFGIPFSEDFAVIFFSFILLLLLFFFLELLACMGLVVFLHVFGLQRRDINFFIFFVAFVFFVGVLNWLFLGLCFCIGDLFPSGVGYMDVTVGQDITLLRVPVPWDYVRYAIFFFLLFFITDLFMYWAYRCLWAEYKVGKWNRLNL